MSFGVAFALPAYNNPISTGLNPFTQSGPTLDLLFTGLPAVDNTFVGQSLSLDFLTQQYQLPAQYSVWVADQGLTAKTFSQIVTFTRGSVAQYVDSTGLITSAAIDVPRFDYNPSTLATQGFLVEEARTNLLPEANAFNFTWTVTNAVINSNDPYPSPDAFSSSVLYIQPIAAGTAALSYSLTKAATATQYSQSIWINSEFGVAVPAFSLSLDDGTTTNRGVAVFSISSVGAGALVSAVSEGNFSGTSATITGYINNWYRITLTTTSNTATTIRFRCFYTAAIASPIVYVWGAQLEVGAFSTSFIYTNGGAVTRAADLAAINTLSPWFNSAQGTLFAQFEASPNSSAEYVNISSGATLPNAIVVENNASNMRVAYYSNNNIPLVLDFLTQEYYYSIVTPLSLGAIGTVGTVNKVATSYEAANLAANRNGGSIVNNTTGAVPASLTQMNIGADPSGANVINRHIKRITYYPRSMANYELQALTV